jgi:flagellar biosynthesis protein FlhA
MGVGLGAASWRMRRNLVSSQSTAAVAPVCAVKETVEDLLKVECLSIEVGLGLVRLVEGGADSPLLRRVGAIRRQLAADLGYVLPAVRLKDNLSLKAHEYAICMKGVEISRFEVPPGCELAIAVGKPSAVIDGLATREPAFGIPALWVRSDLCENARKSGYTVVDPVTVIGTHISEFVRRYAHELFSRQDAKKILDRVAVDNPKLVEDLVPKLLSLPVLQRVVQNLLRERVSIRDATSILEALGEAAASTHNPILLTEFVRQSIRRAVVKPYVNRTGELPAYFLDAASERGIESVVEHGEQTSHLNASPESIRDLISRVERSIPRPEAPTVMIAGSGSRYFMRQILENSMPNLFVLAHNEIPPELKVLSLGIVQ